MGADRFDHLSINAQDRIQGHHRVLKDHGDPITSKFAEVLFGRADQFIALELDRALDHPARWVDQPED